MAATNHDAAHTARPAIVPLLGHPVAHSLSPAFQDAAFAHAGINARYELWDVAPAQLPAVVARLRDRAILGANVTVPHKEAVVALLETIAPLAARIGAVNTIVKRDGLLHGENTDAGGFIGPLHERGLDLAQTGVVLLGAGGAARGVAVALLDAGVPALTIANRTIGRAEALARALGHACVAPLALDDPVLRAHLASATLLVDATARGWHELEPTLPPAMLAQLPADALVYDLTYRQTPLLQAAAARGLATLDGLPMLVEQGALAWQHWIGQAPPRAIMWTAALAARAARQ